MHPIAFYLGNYPIRWYGVMAALGFLAATFLVNANRKAANLSSDQAANAVFLAMIAGAIGARAFYVIQFWRQFADRPLAIFRIDQGGLVFYGGFFLAVVTLLIWCRRQKVDFARMLDLCVPALLVGHAFGRVGCFLNGCCFGAPTSLPWGVVYPENSEPFLRYAGQALHPVQLYEVAANLVLAAIFFPLVRKTGRGVVMSLYLIAYGLLRFLDEFFRGDHLDRPAGLTPAQWIGLVLIPIGLAALFHFYRHGRKQA